MTALERAFRCALLTVLLALAAPVAAQAAGREFKVMVFTRAVGEQHASTAAGVKAIKDLGKERRFIVNATADPTEFRADRLAQFRAVVFLNTSGDVLTDAQQAAFEDYYRDGGGFVGIHSAIDTEPRLGVPDRRPRHALDRARRPSRRRRSRSPTACTTPARACPSTGSARTSGTTSRPTCAAARTCWPRSTRRRTPAARWASTTPSPGARTSSGGRSFYTAGGHTAAAYAEPRLPRATWPARIEWAAGEADPVYSDCGATVLANYEQTKIGAPPNLNEPIGFDVLPDGRILQTARGGQLRLHDPATTRSTGHRDAAGLHQQRGRALRPGGRQRLRHQPLGLPLLRPADMDAPYPPIARRRAPRRLAPHGGPERLGPRGRATSSSRASSSSTGETRRRSTSPPSRRSSRSTTTAARAATSPATSTSTATTTSGSSPATTRRPAAATPAASRRSTTCSPTRRRPFAPRTRAAAPSR